jgi:ribulose 1,5-bisphosphate synthetase/thiazole synthase
MRPFITVTSLVAACAAPLFAADRMTEPAGDLPLVQDVDVAVVGGTCGAVAAAEAAAQAGAKVFLATSYACLGEDVAGTLRVWADAADVKTSPLMEALFGPPPAEGLAYTTPLQVKKTLDKALLDAGVTVLTGSYVTDVLTDGGGAPAGVVMANRSGRQAVRAKVVIDATERGAAARAAGAAFTPFPSGEYEVSRVVIGGNAPKSGGKIRKHDDWKPDKEVFQLSGKTPISPALYECTFTVRFADGGARAFAEARQQAADRTFDAMQLDAADRFHFVAPDQIRSEKALTGDWPGAAALNLGALRPAKVPHLYVLGPMADVPRRAAAEFAKPAAAIEVGARLGRQAAAEAKARGAPTDVRLRGKAAAASGTPADLREVRGTLTAPYANASGTVPADARPLPVLAETELVVVGGGTTGGPAAVGAVRNGIKTLVVEQLYELGGVQTAGMICGYYYGHQRGFTSEIDEGVKATGRWKSQAKGEWYRASVRQGGGEVWFGGMATGALLEGKKLRGVVVVTPEGERGVVLAKAVIDATGNADIAAAAGEPTEFYRPEELINQGVGQAVIRLGAGGHNNDFAFVDDTDASDLCFFGLRTRQMTEAGWDVSQLVNSRERRRLVGVYQMKALDFLTARTFPDTIVQFRSRFDLHGWASGDFFMHKNIRTRNHVTLEANGPYRALLPQTTDGLLVAGVGMSAERDAMSILRMQPDLQNQGYAAAYAVYLALKEGCELRDIPVKALQKHLVEKGVIPESVLADRDSYPIPDDTLKLASHDVMFNYSGLQYLFAEPERAKPHLLAKYRELSTHSSGRDPEVSLVYAHVLAALGEPAGEQELIDWVKTHGRGDTWIEGLGSGANRMDAYLLALGRIKSKKTVPVIAEKILDAAKPTTNTRPDHYRVLALTCQMIGEPALAAPLARLLEAPGIAGHAIKMSAQIPPVPGYDSRSNYSNQEKMRVPREINLAAALYRLGDHEGKGETILKAYAADPRGFYANYARRVLAERKR